MKMPAWYDIVGLSDRAAEDCEGIDGSAQTIFRLIDACAPLRGAVLACAVFGPLHILCTSLGAALTMTIG
jgi:hypothetical protein